MLIVLGCGRSGTKYTALCMQAAGYDFIHEFIKKDGQISHRLRDKYGCIGWNLALPQRAKLRDGATILHQMRNPINCLPTLRGHNENLYATVGRVVKGFPKNNQILRTMMYWYHYNIYCSKMALYSYDVADLGRSEKVTNVVASYGLRGKWDAVSTTTNHRGSRKFTRQMMFEADADLANKIFNSWKRFKTGRFIHFHEAAQCVS